MARLCQSQTLGLSYLSVSMRRLDHSCTSERVYPDMEFLLTGSGCRYELTNRTDAPPFSTD